MLQNKLAIVGKFQQDHVVIGGRTLGFDEILNEAFFAPGKIAELSQTFKNNKPFPHLIFEDLFSPVLLELMYEDFDNLKKDDVRIYSNMNEKKLGTLPFARLGHASELYFNTIHSGPFLNFLAQITGIEQLITDPSLSSGLDQIPTGGKFAMHVDFNQHVTNKLENRLVLITYLNKNWLPSYGGALELWSVENEKYEVEVPPTFGRSILFAHSSKSLHGHPKPVDAPDRRPRRSAATYYYTNGRSDDESTDFHTTIFFKRRMASQREKISIVDGIQNLKSFWRRHRKTPSPRAIPGPRDGA